MTNPSMVIVDPAGPLRGDQLRLHVLSDLHVEHGGFIAPALEVDVVIVAGDLADGPHVHKALRDLRRQVKAPVIYVPGNHDWYGLDLGKDREAHVRSWSAAAPDIQVLDDATWSITRGSTTWRIIGSTWWSAMRWPSGLDSSGRAEDSITDFHVINMRGRFLRALDVEAFHARSSAFLAESCRAARALGETPVVVTHFPPLPLCGHPDYEGDALNAYFLNQAGHLTDGVPLWIYGHVHNSGDHRLPNGCRLVGNPKGYRSENADFQSRLVVTVAGGP